MQTGNRELSEIRNNAGVLRIIVINFRTVAIRLDSKAKTGVTVTRNGSQKRLHLFVHGWKKESNIISKILTGFN